MRNLSCLLIIITLVFLTETKAQNTIEKGIPLLNSYSPSEYGNFGKIWDSQVSKNGIIFFASDKGMLRFDGINWDHFNGSLGYTRSINTIGDSLIATGSDMDFGI